MSVERRGVAQPGPLRWPRHPQLAGDQPESIALYTYLLDADGELAEEFDVRARIAARQLATARVLQVAVGACDLAPWFEAAAAGPRSADPRRPAGARDPGRRPHLGGAGRPGGSASAARSRGGPVARADVRLARAPPREARGARRRFRGPGAAVPADRPHPDAPGVPATARARRAPRDHLAAAARGPPGPASVAPGGALGEGGADRSPAVAAAHPSPARSAGRGRAAVDLARAQAARAGWPRDRPERRPPPPRRVSSSSSRRWPSASRR